MYRVETAGLSQATGAALPEVTARPIPPATKTQARATMSLVQLSLNKPMSQGGVSAGIKPFTYVFDARTEAALRKWLRLKGVSDRIAPGMWRSIRAAGLSEAGAKNWEAAIAYFKKWTGAAPKPKAMLATKPVVRLAAPKQRVGVGTIVSPPDRPVSIKERVAAVRAAQAAAGPAVPAAPAAPAVPTVPTIPAAPPVSYPAGAAVPSVPVRPHPAGAAIPIPGAAAVPAGAAMPLPVVVPPLRKKGLPTWAWVAIGVGATAVVGVVVWKFVLQRPTT